MEDFVPFYEKKSMCCPYQVQANHIQAEFFGDHYELKIWQKNYEKRHSIWKAEVCETSKENFFVLYNKSEKTKALFYFSPEQKRVYFIAPHGSDYFFWRHYIFFKHVKSWSLFDFETNYYLPLGEWHGALWYRRRRGEKGKEAELAYVSFFLGDKICVKSYRQIRKYTHMEEFRLERFDGLYDYLPKAKVYKTEDFRDIEVCQILIDGVEHLSKDDYVDLKDRIRKGLKICKKENLISVEGA